MAKEKTMKKEVVTEKILTKEGYDLSVLNEKELRYFRMMYPKSGVLFLTSEPGIAKSATIRSIANKLGFRYLDLRLAMLDETDVGLFPDKYECEEEVDGKIVSRRYLDHIVPRWAKLANEQPTIIHFEELNRAPLAVRNAALQILLEREIGYDFKFNDSVYMCATGNLGEEDGTDVEEFDSALNGRLIHYQHTLSFEEWYNYFAKEHVQDIIIRYLTAHPDSYYIGKKSRSEKDKSYACPRTWTFLSDYITQNYGFNAPIQTWINDITNIGFSFIGSQSTSFMRYLRDTLRIGIKDIIDRFPQLQAEKVQFSRDKKSELLTDLRSIKIGDLKKNQIENVKLFLLSLGEDEVSAYLLKMLDDDYDYEEDEALDREKNGWVMSFMQDSRFKKFEQTLLGYVKTKEEGEDEDDFWKNK